MGTRRSRLVSATYEGVGARWKEQLSDVSLAVYEETPQMEDIARKVAIHTSVERGSFFVMDASRVEGAMEEWGRALPHCTPFYPLACNDDPLLVELLTRRKHCNLQVSTMLELERALTLVSPSRILFHSHLLTRKMLRLICNLQDPLYGVVVDSEECALDAASLNPYQPLLLRVSLSPDSDHVDLSMGMPIEEAMECVPRLIRCGVVLAGVSLQLLSRGVDMMERAKTLVSLLSALSPYGLSTVDVGDGLESSSLYETSDLLDCILETAGVPHTKMIATPGRFFAATAFTLVTCIVGKRSMDAGVITRKEEDWGTQGFVYSTTESVYGVFCSRLMGEGKGCHPLPLTPSSLTEEHESAVLGNTLDSIDFPQRNARLPSLAVGDCLMWKEMGAYAARDSDSVPVYYYTGRDHWERLKGGEREEKDLLSDGGSEGEGDTDGDSDIDNDDMTECFGRVFN